MSGLAKFVKAYRYCSPETISCWGCCWNAMTVVCYESMMEVGWKYIFNPKGSAPATHWRWHIILPPILTVQFVDQFFLAPSSVVPPEYCEALKQICFSREWQEKSPPLDQALSRCAWMIYDTLTVCIQEIGETYDYYLSPGSGLFNITPSNFLLTNVCWTGTN